MRRLIIAGALALAACGSLTATDTTQTIPKTLIDACNGFAAAESSTAGYVKAGTITPDKFPKIDGIRAPIRTICDPKTPVPTDPLAAVNQVLSATDELVALFPK